MLRSSWVFVNPELKLKLNFPPHEVITSKIRHPGYYMPSVAAHPSLKLWENEFKVEKKRDINLHVMTDRLCIYIK